MSRLLQPRTLRALAFKLADAGAILHVHSFCRAADEADYNACATGCHRVWFTPGKNDDQRADSLEAIRYLVARGILIRNRRAGLVVLAGKVGA